MTWRARIVAAAVEAALQAGCYKVILDCTESNAPFYEACGFKRKELQMVTACPCGPHCRLRLTALVKPSSRSISCTLDAFVKFVCLDNPETCSTMWISGRGLKVCLGHLAGTVFCVIWPRPWDLFCWSHTAAPRLAPFALATEMTDPGSQRRCHGLRTNRARSQLPAIIMLIVCRIIG